MRQTQYLVYHELYHCIIQLLTSHSKLFGFQISILGVKPTMHKMHSMIHF